MLCLSQTGERVLTCSLVVSLIASGGAMMRQDINNKVNIEGEGDSELIFALLCEQIRAIALKQRAKAVEYLILACRQQYKQCRNQRN